MTTHEVSNQPPPLEGIDLFETDRGLATGILREAPGAPTDELTALGKLAGQAETLALGFDANAYPPELRTHDRFGNRLDEVVYHPSYHRLMEHATAFGLHAAPWRNPSAHAHLLRAAKFYIWSQVEAGHGCPISMTYASVAALRAEPRLARLWEPMLAAACYDQRSLPAAEKFGVLCGMAMTEKQGGSDVRANTTRATFVESGAEGDLYRLVGHKWFCSAPMSDAFLTLAQTDEGLTCFLMPRILPDGSRNGIQLQRLKDKLGNRSNASSEMEFDGSLAWRVGAPGRGVPTIAEMINHTRLDCLIGSSALMRWALAQALHHTRYRSAFGKPLIEQPLMRNVLADLTLESEAATALFLRLANAVDRSAGGDPHATALKRLGTAVGKYYVCKRAPVAIGEALECLGGNGYVEESGLPRLYREAPVNSVWEGSGTVNALDVLRILRKQPQIVDAWQSEMAPAAADPRIAKAVAALERELRGDPEQLEGRARAVVERLALLWQAALLMRTSAPLADAFIASRIAGEWGYTLGTLPRGSDLDAILERGMPAAHAGLTATV